MKFSSCSDITCSNHTLQFYAKILNNCALLIVLTLRSGLKACKKTAQTLFLNRPSIDFFTAFQFTE